MVGYLLVRDDAVLFNVSDQNIAEKICRTSYRGFTRDSRNKSDPSQKVVVKPEDRKNFSFARVFK